MKPSEKSIEIVRQLSSIRDSAAIESDARIIDIVLTRERRSLDRETRALLEELRIPLAAYVYGDEEIPPAKINLMLEMINRFLDRTKHDSR